MKFTNLRILFLLPMIVDSFFSHPVRSNRISTLLKITPSDYEDDFKYSTEYYQHLLKYDLIKNSNMLTSSPSDKSISWAIKRYKNYQIFVDNYERIKELNQQYTQFQLDMNQFGDQYPFDSQCNQLSHLDTNSKIITHQDNLSSKSSNLLKIKRKIQTLFTPLFLNKKTPPHKNWKLFLPPVKNQLNCGSCWAFSTTNSIETLMNLHNYSYTRLSEQELVDFSDENDGCGGGLMHLAYDYIIKNQGLVSNNDYPYIIESPYKNTVNISDLKKVPGSQIKDYEFIIPRSIEDIKQSLQDGPIALALDASSFIFRFYKHGIIDLPANFSRDINHAVLLTGYEQDDNGTHWIIQNSWGESWGEQGFARIRVRNGNGVLLCQLYGVYPQY